ncbi:30S ribosome-binding factor RbfA [bacterium]|nr:MAG: 30S ribosome-binding factor RbfA [bacterium]
MTTRQDKVNSLLQRLVAAQIIKEDYEGITGLVTILRADVTADLEQANIYFSVVGQDPDEVLRILKKNIYGIQGMLNANLKMRKVPRIAFLTDASGEYASHISDILHQLPKS